MNPEAFLLSCPYFPPPRMFSHPLWQDIMAWRGVIDNYQLAMARALSGNPWATGAEI